MGLIIKDKLKMFLKGYPTVSDKYNVAGAVLTGSTPAQFGDLVKISGTQGYFEKAAFTAVSEIGGFVVATNVKVAENWPGTTVQVNPGEAFNLLINGFIAAPLDADASIDTHAAVAGTPLANGATGTAGVKYYTRSSSSAGIGHLNDGDYAYTLAGTGTSVVADAANKYYPLIDEGSTDHCTANSQVCVILATGKITTADHYDASTTPYLPNCVFTGMKEVDGGVKIAEIYVK